MALTMKNHQDAETDRLYEKSLLLTIDQASELLAGLTRSYIYAALITPGILKSVKIGRRRLIRRDSLEAYVASLSDEQGSIA